MSGGSRVWRMYPPSISQAVLAHTHVLTYKGRGDCTAYELRCRNREAANRRSIAGANLVSQSTTQFRRALMECWVSAAISTFMPVASSSSSSDSWRANMPPAQSTMTVDLFNARSVKNKLHDIHYVLQVAKPNVACITETWSTSSVSDNLITNDNSYCVFRTDRNISKVDGGVCILRTITQSMRYRYPYHLNM